MINTSTSGFASASAGENTTVLVHTQVQAEQTACAMCHTLALPLGDADIAAGGAWICSRCGQRWDAARLATVAAYTAWDRDRAAGRAILES